MSQRVICGSMSPINKHSFNKRTLKTNTMYMLWNSCKNIWSSGKRQVIATIPLNAVKLEQTTVLTFDGTYTIWISFRNLFKSVMYDTRRLPDVQNLLKQKEKQPNNHSACHLLITRYFNKFIVQSGLAQFQRRICQVESISS